MKITLLKKLVFLMSIISFDCFAQWSTDSSVNNPICTTDENQVGAQMTSDGSGGAIITWQDRFGGSDGANIYAQRIDAAGIVQWTTNGVAVCTAVNDQHTPQIISDGNGGAIITWYDARISGNIFPQIYGQRINSSGVRQWTNNGVVITPNNRVEQGSMSIVSNGSGGAIIAWVDHQSSVVNDPTGNNIYAQQINSLGVIQWGLNQWGVTGIPVCDATDNQYGSGIVSDGNGGAFMTWRDYRNGTNYDVYAQHINALGEAQWAINGIAICTRSGDQTPTSLISDGNDGAIIVWGDSRNGTNNIDIYAQRINSSGVIQWANNGIVVNNAVYNQITAYALYDNSGGAIIVWREYRSGGYYNIYAQRINSLGIKQWTSNGILINTVSNDLYSAKIVSDGSDGAIISWNEYRNGSGSGDIYAQYLDGNGLIQWTPNGVAIATAANDQNDNQIISDGSGNAIIAWTDNRTNSNYDVYAQRINMSGSLSTQVQTALNKAAVSVYPNPSKGRVTIEATETITSISIFNELGKIVHNETCGDCSIKELDLRKLSKGLYFYKIISGEDIITNGKLIITE